MFKRIKNNTTVLSKYEGANIIVPKYRCSNCDLPIELSYALNTGQCGYCHEGYNEIGISLDRVYSVSFYVPPESKLPYKFSQEIREFKDGNHVEKMAKVLKYGINNRDNLKNFDAIVPPPRGENKENHMIKAGQKLSEISDMPLRPILEKEEDYKSQKTIDDPEKRKENVKNKMRCNSEIEADRILLIDDVATTCSTLSESARAIKTRNSAIVRGLVLGRDTTLQSLKNHNVVEEEKDE